jgi:hypothetical protein
VNLANLSFAANFGSSHCFRADSAAIRATPADFVCGTTGRFPKLLPDWYASCDFDDDFSGWRDIRQSAGKRSLVVYKYIILLQPPHQGGRTSAGFPQRSQVGRGCVRNVDAH